MMQRQPPSSVPPGGESDGPDSRHARCPEDEDLTAMLMHGRVAVVSGAAAGIGLEAAGLLGRRGASLVLFDKDAGRLQQAADDLAATGIEVLAVHGSVIESADCDAVASRCVERFGRIDILVNNAGGSAIPTMPLWQVSDAQWEMMMQLNLMSAFKLCRAVIPHMLERGYGRIINVASTAGKEGNPNTAAYCTAKAGVMGMTKSLGKELAMSGILVNAIAPAVIETSGTRNADASPEHRAHMDALRAKIPMARMGHPREVARLIAFLASEHLSYSTGAVFDISGGRATY